jgi:single-strand DNA-binding protein
MADEQFAYVNRVVMTGHVVRDPEFRHTTTGAPVSNFRIASVKQYEDADGRSREETCYVGVAAWHDLAEACRDFLNKGSAIQIDGELKSRVRESGDGIRRSFVEIRARKIRLFRESGEHADFEESVESAPMARPGTFPFRASDTQEREFEPFNTADREEL